MESRNRTPVRHPKCLSLLFVGWNPPLGFLISIEVYKDTLLSTATCLVLGRQLGSYSAGVEPKDHQKIVFFLRCVLSLFSHLSLSLFLFLFHKSPSHQAINYSSFCVFLGGQMGQMDKLLELRSHLFLFFITWVLLPGSWCSSSDRPHQSQSLHNGPHQVQAGGLTSTRPVGTPHTLYMRTRWGVLQC